MNSDEVADEVEYLPGRVTADRIKSYCGRGSQSLRGNSLPLRIKRDPSISFVIANYREIIVVFAESELWLTLCVDWLLSIFYCYLLTFGKLTR